MTIRSNARFRFRSLSPVVLAVLVGGCSSEEAPVDHTAAARSAITNTETALRGVASTVQFLEDSKLVAKTFDAEGESIEFERDFSEGIGDLTRFLSEKVFSSGNVESETGSSVIYRLKPENVCPMTSSDSAGTPGSVPDSPARPAPESKPVPDPECVEFLTENPVRLRVTAPREGDVDVAVLVSDERHNPITFNLYRQSVGVSFDLGEAFDVARLVNASDDLPEKLDGLVQLELLKNAERDYSLKLNVLKDIAVAARNDGDRFEFALTKSNGTFEARFDGNQKTVKLSENLGTASMKVPLSRFISGLFDEDAPPTPIGSAPATPTSNSSDVVSVVLAGLTGSALFDAKTDKLSLSGLGLGAFTSTVKQGNATLFSADLNPNSGRKFDLDVSLGADGEPLLVVSPNFDLNLAFAFQQVADRVQNLPSHSLNDTLRVWLTSSAGVPSIKGMANGTIQVVSGELGMSSSAAPEHNLTLVAGQCLSDAGEDVAPPPFGAPVPDANESEHPLSDFSLSSCN